MGARRVWRAQEKHGVVRGAALKSSPNFSSAFFCDSIDAQLIKAGTNFLMATEQNFPSFWRHLGHTARNTANVLDFGRL